MSRLGACANERQIPFGKNGAEHLFGFFSQCYERTGLIVTTNLPFADWPQAFAGDERTISTRGVAPPF